MAQRQGHHIGEATDELIDRMKAGVLNGVCAGLVDGSRGDVGFDFGRGVITRWAHPVAAEVGHVFDLSGYRSRE